MPKSVLLIVERDFMVAHVGVRRVILHYWASLQTQGHVVTVGAAIGGQIVRAGGWGLGEALRFAQHEGSDASDWNSDTPVPVAHFGWPTRKEQRGGQFSWTTSTLSLDQFDTVVLTNPWLCSEGIPEGPITTGIVYDMIPNLLACNTIDFGQFIDIYDFANKHDVGYQVYLSRAKSISCISESSRLDFSRFYRLSETESSRVTTDVPFSISRKSNALHVPNGSNSRPRLLLVNILDLRKNFIGAQTAIVKAMAKQNFDIDIVGRERVPASTVQGFLDTLTKAGANVRWFRSASDDRLNRLYAGADALFFPSFYEGLGLPILEAQSHGVPVICSTSPSCVEINMNPELCVPPRDYDQMANVLGDVLHGRGALLKGALLQDRLGAYLAPRSTGFPGAR